MAENWKTQGTSIPMNWQNAAVNKIDQAHYSTQEF